jgi:hypothetical protein
MATSLTDADAVAAFALLAEDFCALVEQRESLGCEGLLRAVHVRLAPLYAAALALPSVEALDDTSSEVVDEAGIADSEEPDVDVSGRPTESSPDRMSHEEWMALYRSLSEQLGERDLYAEVFDPYLQPPKEPVIASLADDIADIYRDLAEGRIKWRQGASDEAWWQWRFHFTIHWGEHATNALRALHALAADYELGFPAAKC